MSLFRSFKNRSKKTIVCFAFRKYAKKTLINIVGLKAIPNSSPNHNNLKNNKIKETKD